MGAIKKIKNQLNRFLQLTKRWRDLAPDITRQRLVLEGTIHSPFSPEQMTEYCNDMSKVLDMNPITSPMCNYSPKYGWCAYMHWEESGMHVYTWDSREPNFFSVDVYTCKSFDKEHAIKYTQEFFGDNLIDLVWKE
jgi:S-adenosylmethionine decarboxylase